ncbi:MAG: hypothetical protein GF311_25325 [Candidatus Lokiarchaeota archaeon]|nr:hypothetical protein [Candidatus Lokiarchaeota archaeon]
MKILIFSAHPDDEVIGLGGTIAKLKDRNNYIEVVSLTKGEKSRGNFKDEQEAAIIRVKELEESTRILGVDKLDIWDLKDTKIKLEDTYRLARDKIVELKPYRVYIPPIDDRHQDHVIAGRAIIMACEQKNINEIIAYESIRKADKPNLYEDISDYLKIKMKALCAHKSQIKKKAFSPEIIRSKALVRGQEIDVEAAEGFNIIKYINN